MHLRVHARSRVDFQIGDDPLSLFWVSFTSGILYLCTPFVLAHMQSPASFVVRSLSTAETLCLPMNSFGVAQSLIRFFPAYYFFLPTIVSDFVSYALCRLDDWSWGNKEAMLTTAQIKVGDCAGLQ